MPTINVAAIGSDCFGYNLMRLMYVVDCVTDQLL